MELLIVPMNLMNMPAAMDNAVIQINSVAWIQNVWIVFGAVMEKMIVGMVQMSRAAIQSRQDHHADMMNSNVEMANVCRSHSIVTDDRIVGTRPTKLVAVSIHTSGLKRDWLIGRIKGSKIL